jgi:RNA polymerase sigma-70 factor (ECF subfamily)
MTDWNTIIDRHGRIVWQTAYRLLGNDADAWDCYQNAFLDAVRVDAREIVRDWPTLLRLLATRGALALLRKRYRGAKVEPGASVEELMSRAPGPLQEAEATELADRIRAALVTLPEQQAEVVCLRWLDELTYQEIGEQLGLAPGTVGVLLHRARKRLQRQLDPRQHEMPSES